SDLVAGVMKDWVQGKGMPYPEHLIDVTTIPELSGIRVGSGGAAIGAATMLTDVIEHAALRRGWPLLPDAAAGIAAPLIPHFGTLGGNLNQRPRCWFFRGEASTAIRRVATSASP